MNRALPVSALPFLAMACKPSQDTSIGIATDGGSSGGAPDAGQRSSSSGKQDAGSGESSTGLGTAGGGPEVLYERSASASRPEVDETHLYWAEAAGDGLRIMAAPKDGSGPVEALGEWYGNDIQSHLVATDAQYIYRRYDTKIIRMNRMSRELTEIELGEGHAQGSMIGDSDFLYIVDRDCSVFIVVDKSSLAVM